MRLAREPNAGDYRHRSERIHHDKRSHHPRPPRAVPGIADTTRVTAGDPIFISGQVDFEEDGSVPADFARAIEVTYGELERALNAAGAMYENLVRVSI